MDDAGVAEEHRGNDTGLGGLAGAFQGDRVVGAGDGHRAAGKVFRLFQKIRGNLKGRVAQHVQTSPLRPISA